MTSEVVIMNRRAIVLAADSAMTVPSFHNGRRETKYYKGANKVFELSHHGPVGLMIFDSADVHSVPWEIIIKSDREHLGRNSFPSLEDYARDLFSFVENHLQLFPPERQEALFKGECINAVFTLRDWINQDARVTSADEAAKPAVRGQVLEEIRGTISSEALAAHFPANAVADAVARVGEDVEAQAAPILGAGSEGLDPKLMAAVVIEAIFKRYPNFLSHTGIVLGGYGEADYFPGFCQYDCYGILLGKFIADKGKEGSVSVDNSSHIQPFATNAMVHTFMSGIGPDVFGVVMAGFDHCLSTLAQKVQAELGVPEIPNLAAHHAGCLKEFQERLINAQVEEHYLPLARAVGSLPLEEMASLAETLIMLESLKEKVTRPSESVGGPVDVAVITKSEGLVWIKRKHYFSPDLNTRYLERQRQRLV